MAIKEKKVESKSKLVEILTTEYKWENLLLGILATLSTAFSIMILSGILVVNDTFPVIGDYPMVFAGILLGISILGLLLVIYPFFIPAIPELKKMTWADWPTMLDASARVIIFVLSFALIFFGFDLLIQLIMGYIL